TRGHANDLEVQAQALKTPARYIGVIGSKKKTKIVRDRLLERGFTEEDLDRITAPIGLNIGGKSPAEIAVSITAQLIQIRSADYKQGN
ncbi:MAG: XdhC family protein, partial [Eubacteriales bacterium]|nr:XdhC family protein [Eubacteriales bacterium]